MPLLGGPGATPKVYVIIPLLRYIHVYTGLKAGLDDVLPTIYDLWCHQLEGAENQRSFSEVSFSNQPWHPKLKKSPQKIRCWNWFEEKYPSKWESSPIFGVKIKDYLKPTTYIVNVHQCHNTRSKFCPPNFCDPKLA